ncbi:MULTISPECIES: hypothetical protein [Bacillaceae]|uniref:hypothetical protein n=1 Tax=Bacillaceae TaxID=186817 RepID=UPI001E4DDBC1|nr:MULTISPECIES: hypothetical protein [Bacillaceae]MCE4050619.1 hypothetical protein [Bacillus sp. Au-Bac7]MCM3031981.1 hypothetical protein [Niallia sp. MER 6]MDL0436014.1 hypothetical protein [Niallia sp. SS-2023]UPO87880.1 hypothetical protein L8T27_001270 [Niallia sp. Man26]
MKDSIKRIVGRLKKYIWAILIICVAMPILGWFMPTGNGQSEYTSEAIIKLGNYETSYLTNADQLVSLLSNEASFKQILPDVWEEEVTDKLAVSSTPSKLLVLSLTGKTEEEALNNLTTIVDGFMKLDQSSFEEKSTIIESSIQALETENASSDTIVDQQRFLYELKNEKLGLEQAILIKDVYVKGQIVEASAEDRVILGALLGIMASILILITPEFIRAHSRQ